MTTNICPRTNTRRAACLCSVCSMDKDPATKGAANKRDVIELLGMITAAVERHPDLDGPANWAKASTIANLRQQLRDIAVGLALRDGKSEEEAAARIEAALERGDAL